MNDEELRSRFDVMVDRVPAKVDAESVVRARAGRIRRRRTSAAVAGLVVLVGAAVAVPGVLQHQGKSSTNVAAGLSTTCDPAAVRAAVQYGSIDRMYGEVTTASELASWRKQVGGADERADTLAPGAPVSLCLLVGTLDGPATGGAPGVHYAVITVIDGVAGWVYYSPAPAEAGPMPGIKLSDIRPWAGPTTTPAPAAAATASAGPLTSAPPPSPGVASAAAIEVPPCTSHTVSGVLRGVGLVDGVIQGGIEISTTSTAGCFLRGNLQMAVLTPTGAVLPVPPGGLPGPTHGVYAPLPVDTVLAAVPAGHSHPAQSAGQLLRVIVGDDGGTACAARDRHARPARFRLTIGTVVITVANLDAAASDTGKQSIVGCPGRFYAGSATLQ